MPCRTGNRATPRQKTSNQHRLIAPLVGALWMLLKIGFRIKKKNKTTKFAHTAMPEARNPPLNRHGVHLPKQQAPPSPARQSYRTKIPRAGAITPPSQVIRSRPGDVSLPRRGRGDGETEPRNTQIAKMRLGVSLQLFRRSRRKRKTAGKTPALPLALFREESGPAPQRPTAGGRGELLPKPTTHRRLSQGEAEAGIARAGERQAPGPPGATGALPGQRPAATHCCSASPLPLPLQPPATPRPHPSAGRAPGLRSQPSPSPSPGGGGRQRFFPRSPPRERERCAPPAEPPMRALGRFQPNSAHCAPVRPSPLPPSRGVRAGAGEEEEET